MSPSELAAFFERLDQQIEDTEGQLPDPEVLADDAEVGRRGLLLQPIFDQRAERAGLALPELVECIGDRCGPTASAIEHRIDGALEDGREIRPELMNLAISAGMQFFLAGVLWEQARHLPTLEA